MRKLTILLLLSTAFAQEKGSPRVIHLPNSKVLHLPAVGYVGQLNGFTPTAVVSPNKRFAAFLSDGYGTQKANAHQSIAIMDLKTNQITDFPEERLSEEAKQSYFIGMAFSSDGTKLYASIGSITDPTGEKAGNLGNGIAVYSFNDGKITPAQFLKVDPARIADGKRIAHDLNESSLAKDHKAIPYPAGLAIIPGNPDRLLVANNYSDNVSMLDSNDGHLLQSFDVSSHEIIPNSYPHSIVVSNDGKLAWCSLWNASKVAQLDLANGKVTRYISVGGNADPSAPGSHPTAMLLSPDGRFLYVALANADKVAVVEVGSGEIVRTLSTEMPGQKFHGTVPSALSQTADGKKLFVADSGLNAIAVFEKPSDSSNKDISPRGFIPTEWYPTALATVGHDLLIVTSKGQSTGADNGQSVLTGERRHRVHPYIATLLYGSVARLSFSEIDKRLPSFTRQVQEDSVPVDASSINLRPQGAQIKHVIYILKENRTYDQVFGDLRLQGVPVGNGDTKLTLYGLDITPNLHKLALQFGVLDNFYDSGEVSGDGHVWSSAGTTSDYNENTWQIAYRGNERTYDYQGDVAGETPFNQGRSDIDAPATGFLWDNLAAHGLTYRDYGEFVEGIWCRPEAVSSPKQGTPSPLEAECPIRAVKKGEVLPDNVGQPHGSPSPWPWAVPMLKETKATKKALVDHFDPRYPDFSTDYPDQLRADEFLNEFDGFVQARNRAEKSESSEVAELPQFVLLYLPDDHTGGLRARKPRPAASVADNDLAVGRVVDAVSHSPYWDDTAIFVVEDDAQDGADHVDAHRSIALQISKYSPGSAAQPFVDSHFYTTVNMLHTMESLLGLPAMNLNDGYAPVMSPLFTGPGTQAPFTADFHNRDNGLIYQINPDKGKDAKESSKLDFSRPDANNAHVLNAILWRDQKGKTPMPAAQHHVIPPASARDND